MKRGKLSRDPSPRFWLDYRILLDDMDYTMKLLAKLASDVIFFDFAVKKLPVKKDVVNWATRNHNYAFDVIVFGGTGMLDQLLAKRLEGTWFSEVLWSLNMLEVRAFMKKSPWILGFLTAEKELIDPDRSVFEWTGSNMSLKNIPIL